MIIDFHHHFTPYLKNTPTSPRARYEHDIPVYTDHRGLLDIRDHITLMDEAGIDAAILTSGYGLYGELESSRKANEELAKICSRYPGRLLFLAHAAPLAGKKGLMNLERWLEHCPGAAIPSTLGSVNLDDRRLERFYEMLEKSNRYLFVHPALSPSEVEAKIYDAFDLYRTVGREFSLILSTLRLIFGGVLDRHPNLKIVMSHLGGGISSLIPRIRLFQDKAMWGIAQDRVHGRTCAKPFDGYLSRIYFDTAGFSGDPKAFQIALLHIPKANLLFGTDYPQEIRTREPIRQFVKEVKSMGLDGNGTQLVRRFLKNI